jgi:F0F1-type ATP synthase membrane subunit c/vacuolar-type H+-ATPase subunit K
MFLNCSCDLNKSRPAAMRMLAIGLLLVSCGIAWQHVFAPLLHLSADQDDFFRGLCMGLGITLEIMALVVLARIRANHQCSDPSGK